MAGIRTVSDLRDRCRPAVWLLALKQRVSVGFLVCVLRTGKAPASGVIWHCTCGTRDCCNPEHRRPGTRSSMMRAAGLHRTADIRARVALEKRRASSALSDAAVDEIRRSTDTLRAIAARHGISFSYAGRIRRGECRRPIGFSVFSQGATPPT